MYGINHKLLIAIILISISSSFSFAQTDQVTNARSKRNKSFVLYIGGGISYYTPSVSFPAADKSSITRTSPATTARIMWYPQYRLRIGIESGKTTFYSYKLTNGDHKGKLSLTAIPILITWSMHIFKRVNIYAGFGSYFLTTHLNYEGSVNSKMMSLGSNLALAYQQPVYKTLQLAIEAKWMNAFETKNNALSLQLQLAWKFLEWSSR